MTWASFAGITTALAAADGCHRRLAMRAQTTNRLADQSTLHKLQKPPSKTP